MANYSQVSNTTYTDTLQTPMILDYVIDFECKSQDIQRAKLVSPPTISSSTAIKLNMNKGVIKIRRRKRHFEYGCNRNNRLDEPLKVANLSHTSQQANHSFSPLTSPFTHLHLTPIDLSSSMLNSNDTSAENTFPQDLSTYSPIPEFGISDIPIKDSDTNQNVLYEECDDFPLNLGIKISNILLGQSDKSEWEKSESERSESISNSSNFSSEAPGVVDQTITVLCNITNEANPLKLEDDSINVLENSHMPSVSCEVNGKLVEQQSSSNKKPQEKSSSPGPKFSCSRCKRVYNYKFNMNRHMKFECRKENAFECTICKIRFPYKQNCIQHIKRTHKEIRQNNQQYLADGLVKNHLTLDTFGKATAKPLDKDNSDESEDGVNRNMDDKTTRVSSIVYPHEACKPILPNNGPKYQENTSNVVL